MDQLEQALKNLPEAELPRHLHSHIMRQATIREASRSLAFAGIISVVNLTVVGWEIIARAIDNDFLSVTSAMLDGWQMTTSFWEQFLVTAFQALPALAVTVFVFNLILTGYIAYQGWKLYQDKLSLSRQVI